MNSVTTPMKAMIFAAGLGTRLKPFTLSHPKALVHVQGKPMLQRVIEKMLALGITEIVVNVHHFAQQIVDFLRENNNFGANIIISDETGRLLDTGGGILAARQWLDGNEPFLVHNADILTNADLPALIDAHRRSDALATLLVERRATSRFLLFDPGTSLMRGWTNMDTGETKPSGLDASGLTLGAFQGIHVLSPAIFPLLQEYGADNPAFGITPFYIDACAKAPILGCFQASPYSWLDVGKPESLQKAEEATWL